MPHLIDTDWLIDYLDNDPQALALIDPLIPTGVAISVITYMEAYQGTLRKPDVPRAQAEVEAFLQHAPILPISLEVARRCAQLREDLRRQRKRVRDRALDLLTAAVALEHGLTLVTRNRDDYKDIPGLQLH
jgi:predicted nucleic acid-binding protein